MKKSLFFAAAVSALMLTACSSENDVVQSAAQLQQSEPKAVGFDVYTQDANEVTRAGYEGIMNTTRLQGIANGFGIFGYYTDTNDGDATPQEYPFTTPATSGSNDYIPNFMWNQQVRWNATNKGWAYAPLKYWPNETINDSQSNPAPAYMEDNSANGRLDRLTFFAYAPFVDPSDAGFTNTQGIRAITDNKGILTALGTGTGGTRAKGDPAIEYKSAGDAANSVDLLWGVAPAGGQHYTAVDGKNNGADEGMPYLNLTKPDVNTSLKFYFQHALARFGFTVAAAIDQVPQGGSFAADDATRITVESVTLSGYFGTEGVLNLNNKYSNIANWINLGSGDLADGSTVGTAPLELKSFTIDGDNIATTIKDSGSDAVQTVDGVTTAKKDLIQGKFSKVDAPTNFSTSVAYYTSAGVEIRATMSNNNYFTYDDANNKYVPVTGTTINSPAYGNTIPTYYTITPGTKLTADPGATTHGPVYKKVGEDYEYFSAADVAMGGTPDFTNDEYYIPTITDKHITAADFSYTGTDFYQPERSFYMVIPTNNVEKICRSGVTSDADKNLLKTVWVEITYYVTTEDTNLDAGFSRVKNVIKKKVELPSLANGKSYNLHLLLGLTSVKVEAEVGDWQEVYVQTDLPQNTPGE